MVRFRQLQSRRKFVAAPRGGAATFSLLLLSLAGFGLSVIAGEQEKGTSRKACKIVAMTTFPEILLAAEDKAIAADQAVVLGGLSDLSLVESVAKKNVTGEITIQLITDRGPTSKIKTISGKRRVFHNPAFTPTLLQFSLSGLGRKVDGQCPTVLALTKQAELKLRCPTGAILTGRPNGLPGDEIVYEPTGQQALPNDANGIDSEGIVVCRDGSLWLTEESLPSIMRVAADGTVVCRYVPEGVSLSATEMDVVTCLPARYQSRRRNRGFEAVAISPNEATLWVMLQSPLLTPHSGEIPESGIVRLLAFDTQRNKPRAEYLYRLGDPANPLYAAGGATPEDGKLCAMAAIDASTLLVLEQSDDGDASLYRCDLQAATDTLDDSRWFEEFADLSSVKVVPVAKSLVANLEPLLPQFAADITAGQWKPQAGEPIAGLKLEGLGVVDPEHVLLVNDNDFNVDRIDDPGEPLRRSCLWMISLPQPLRVE